MLKKLAITGVLLFQMNGTTWAADKVIYGEDNRINAEDSPNLLYKELAKSTAAMIPAGALSSEYDGTLAKITAKALNENMNVCEDERFADQMSAGMCSGFLVGQNLLVTAGHCIQNQDACRANKWVFNYRQDLLVNSEEAYINSEDVYSCKRIVSQVLSPVSKNDYALIELDRNVEQRAPLKFRKQGRIEESTEIVVIGHPSGLPTIIADGAKVRNNDNDFYFSANLDTFGGNSGSAVFNAQNGQVEGILVRGERDYRFDEDAGCYRVFECADDACRGEDVTRITVIPELAPGMTPEEPVVAPSGNDPLGGLLPFFYNE